MLALQHHIHTHGIESLASLGIKVYRHPSLPLCGFKYSQINSPRNHPVVMECRGIVLEDVTWKVVAKPFRRFFNVGEYVEEFKSFDWTNSTCITKEDGSLAILYYYANQWHVNTSGSFGLGKAFEYDGCWRDLFWNYAGFTANGLSGFEATTLIFELCTPYNKVVKRYENPGVFLIGIVDTHTMYEYSERGLNTIAHLNSWRRPTNFEAHLIEAVGGIIASFEASKEMTEGVVIRDGTTRWKWKAKDYLALHRLKDNGNIIRPKRLCEVVLTNETSEVLAVMPEVTTALCKVEKAIDALVEDLDRQYWAYGTYRSQKTYALAIKDHKFSWVLFKLRKMGRDPNDSQVKQIRSMLLSKVENTAAALFPSITFTFDI